MVTGGKDPDDVLREQGAAVLKAQLAATAPFIDALFTRERDAETLDTPERRAGLKQRLRKLAQEIADKDLAQAYRDELLARFDRLFAADRGEFGRPDAARRDGFPRKGAPPAPFAAWPTAEGKAAAKRLALALEPIPAALARRALIDPAVLDDHLEAVQTHGFCDPALMELAKEIIRLRLTAELLDSEALQRHLAMSGFSALLNDIDRAAANAGAPFLFEDVTLAVARSQWSHAFEVLNRVAALEDALSAAKQDLAGGAGASPLIALKAERDALRRAIKTGTIWKSDTLS